MLPSVIGGRAVAAIHTLTGGFIAVCLPRPCSAFVECREEQAHRLICHLFRQFTVFGFDFQEWKADIIGSL